MEGFFPISEVWEEGAWTTGDFIVALLLCLICVGILVFIYMLAVKPNNGTLTVTYEKREEEQTCPKCAERVKVAASVCRFCGHIF